MIIDGTGAMFEDRRKSSVKQKKVMTENGEIVKDRRKSKDQIKKKK